MGFGRSIPIFNASELVHQTPIISPTWFRESLKGRHLRLRRVAASTDNLFLECLELSLRTVHCLEQKHLSSTTKEPKLLIRSCMTRSANPFFELESILFGCNWICTSIVKFLRRYFNFPFAQGQKIKSSVQLACCASLREGSIPLQLGHLAQATCVQKWRASWLQVFNVWSFESRFMKYIAVFILAAAQLQ